MSQRQVWTSLLAALIISTSGSAQQLIRIGSPLVLRSVGDINGDGVPDVAEYLGLPGSVVLSSGNWQPILSLPGDFVVTSADDCDADGLNDLVVEGPGSTFGVVSGVSGSSIWTKSLITWGAMMASDIDGDGVDDLMVIPAYGAPIEATSGATGQVFFTVHDPSTAPCCDPEFFSIDEDVNVDGYLDFALSYTGGFSLGSGPGIVHIVSGFDGSYLYTLTSTILGGQFGHRVTGIGDLDFDGRRDICVFEPGTWNAGFLNLSLGVGKVHLYSSATGNLISTFNCPPNCTAPPWLEFGGPGFGGTIVNVIGCSDQDGDGYGDYVIGGLTPGIPAYPTERIALVSGRNAQLIYDFMQPPLLPAAAYYGPGISLLSDLDGDGLEEFVGAASYATATTYAAYGYIFSLRPTGTFYFGHGTTTVPSAEPRIGAGGVIATGSTLTINLSNVDPSVSAALVIGTSDQNWAGTSLPLDLTSAGLPGTSLLTSPDSILFTGTVGGVSGRAAFEHTFLPGQIVTGATFFAQWFVETPSSASAPYAASRGMRFVFP